MAMNFKFNWGTGIAIFYVSFVIAMLSFVFWVSGQKTDLVTDDYYQEELVYQNTIDNRDRAEDLLGDVVIEGAKGKLDIKLPEGMDNKAVKGELFMYRQDDKNKDTKFKFDGTRTTFSFESERIVTGLWKAKLSWAADGKNYYYENNIMIK